MGDLIYADTYNTSGAYALNNITFWSLTPTETYQPRWVRSSTYHIAFYCYLLYLLCSHKSR